MRSPGFTPHLQEALARARVEAHNLRHDHIGPEHLALGVLLTPPTSGTGILSEADAQAAAAEIVRRAGPGNTDEPRGGPDLPYSPRAKRVMEGALREARSLAHDRLGCGHLLLGVLRDEEDFPKDVFHELGLDLDAVRASVRQESDSHEA